MTSINSTPAEIQQKILRHVIHVADFLDPDAIASTDILAMSDYHAASPQSRWNNLKPYWSTERDRNSCRRVCVSWNIYLEEKIGHRYVDMVNISHGILPASALKNAIRVSVSIHTWGCPICKGIRHNGGGASFAGAREDGFARFLRDTLTTIGETRTQIITGVRSKDLAILADYMPDVVTITNLLGLSYSISRFSQLRQLYVEAGDTSKTHILDAPNLRTLSFTPRLLINTNFVQPGRNLRNLRTLRVQSGYTGLAQLHKGRVILPLLRAIGPNLKNLFLAYTYLPLLTAEIWEICPNLENITATKNGSPIMGLPSSHPLRTVIIPCYGQEGPLVDVPTTHEPSQIRTVVVDCPWGYRFPETLIRSWADHWMRHSIHAKDIYGVPVQDWIAILDQRKACNVYPQLGLPN